MTNKETGEVKPPSISQGIGILIFVLLIIFLFMAGCPQYEIYRARLEGKAQLAHATYSKEVAVATSKAKYESAIWEAGADTVTAHGVARSNEIIGNSLKNNEAYLYFKWLQTLQEMKGEGQVIYLPGNFPNLELPITEANRLQKKVVVQKQE